MEHKTELYQHQNFILQIIHQTLAETNGVSFEEFQQNEQMKEMLYSQIQEIGQAAQEVINLNLSTLDNQEIYKIMSSFRNARYHQEAELDHGPVWDIVKNDLPRFEQILENDIQEVESY
ncbi:HepT-like ribonuclease domain-containing protein [Flexithrix dorotheae]|uniref:HepT-like ribonuclease domain-containing protein n=1 Tax=Flexithrix dorotheae TaxID=70993 RepID=UPI000366F476|nr:HepT-like ribonuclease domain-containing protein [Flexithrix dorotheae]